MIGNMENISEKSAFVPYDSPYNHLGKDDFPGPTIVKTMMHIVPSVQFKRGDFVVYYEPVVKANVLINVQDFYWAESRILGTETITGKKVDIKYKRWVYYKAYNLERNHLYYDGSKLGIIFEEYPDVRYATHDEINRYMETLKKENLTL